MQPQKTAQRLHPYPTRQKAYSTEHHHRDQQSCHREDKRPNAYGHKTKVLRQLADGVN